MTDYDDPTVEEQWCSGRREDVVDYLKEQRVEHRRVGEWPAWHVAPYVSVWAIESKKAPDQVGWWVICGDLPTDCVSSAGIKHPREAVRAIAQRWRDLVPYLERGEPHPAMSVGTAENQAELAPLLKARSELLSDWVKDDAMWPQ